MLIAPIAPVVPQLAGPRVLAPVVAGTSHGLAPLTTAPAPAAAPAAAAAAIDGVARLRTAPIVDFPGIAAGAAFDIVKGSKVGFLGVTGNAVIDRFDNDGAVFHVKAGKFGVKVDVVVTVERVDDQHVRISSKGSGIPDQSAVGRIVASRTNFAEFERVDAPDEHTVISRSDDGGIVIDTVVPTLGTTHLVLRPS